MFRITTSTYLLFQCSIGFDGGRKGSRQLLKESVAKK